MKHRRLTPMFHAVAASHRSAQAAAADAFREHWARAVARCGAGSATPTWPRSRCRRRSAGPPPAGRSTACPRARRLGDRARPATSRSTASGASGRCASEAAAARAAEASQPAPDLPGGTPARRPPRADLRLLPPGALGRGQVALTLRLVGGLSTPEIARAFLVPEAAMAQRLVRAKRRIRVAGIPFATRPSHRPARAARHRCGRALPDLQRGLLGVVRRRPVRHDLCDEAIRLARLLRRAAAGRAGAARARWR